MYMCQTDLLFSFVEAAKGSRLSISVVIIPIITITITITTTITITRGNP